MQHAQQGSPAEARSLYYLHIPKTAGTSLISFLDAQFAPAEICPAQLLPELFALGRDQVGDYRFYRGHLWHGLERHVGRPLRYLTMLRDPLRRTVSWFSHVRRDPGAYRHEQVVRENWSLLDFVNDERTRWDLVNAQTVFLALDLDHARLAADPVGYGQQAVRDCVGRGDDPALLALARRRLESMHFGITERLADSLTLFAHAFGFDPGMPAPCLNVSAARADAVEVSAEARAAIERATVLDRALYAWAVERFNERFSEMARELVIAEAVREGRMGRAWRSALRPGSMARIGVESVECGDSLPADGMATARVVVRNDSGEVLGSRPPHPVHVAYHWVDADSGAMEVFDGERTTLPAAVAAGGRVALPARVRAPARPGRFRLQVRLVQEGVGWLEHGGPACDPEVQVHAA